MSARAITRPVLRVDADARQPAPVGVGVYGLDPDAMERLDGYLQAGGLLQPILRVTVARTGASAGENLPDVFGRYRVVEDGVRFVPYFPFEPGLSYRASFDPRPFGGYEHSDVVAHEFSLPTEQSVGPAKVEHIFPSSDELPENLLRFYVCFSNPMRRGRARAEISLLGSDGEPAPDALYRAPVELWDKSMRRLTILLDPGRLKRGVGPNRELGPPLKAGQAYTLAVGAGMTDLYGGQLSATVHKGYRVTEAVRESIGIEQWRIALPAIHSRDPLTLAFPRPLDWALLSESITVASTCERPIDGRFVIDRCERRWSFTPASPWAAGSYHIRVASSLEDVCGNGLAEAFDRPLRPGPGSADEKTNRSIPFRLG